MKIKSQILLIVLVLFLLCFFYVWPGLWRYRYYQTHHSSPSGPRFSSGTISGTDSMRTDRLTGQVQVWHGRWQKAEKE